MWTQKHADAFVGNDSETIVFAVAAFAIVSLFALLAACQSRPAPAKKKKKK